MRMSDAGIALIKEVRRLPLKSISCPAVSGQSVRPHFCSSSYRQSRDTITQDEAETSSVATCSNTSVVSKSW